MSKSIVSSSCSSSIWSSASALGSSGISGGSNVLKKLSQGTCSVTNALAPFSPFLPLTRFFTSSTVTSLPSFQSILQPMNCFGTISSSGCNTYVFVSSLLPKKGFSRKQNVSLKPRSSPVNTSDLTSSRYASTSWSRSVKYGATLSWLLKAVSQNSGIAESGSPSSSTSNFPTAFLPCTISERSPYSGAYLVSYFDCSVASSFWYSTLISSYLD
mmetsp:Transcript_45439/g.135574  ORF Transcript_45439/g.135574 Transcript_45439/m.135574 type:complete len:214 (+) Transcript_45439:812-1453(+)